MTPAERVRAFLRALSEDTTRQAFPFSVQGNIARQGEHYLTEQDLHALLPSPEPEVRQLSRMTIQGDMRIPNGQALSRHAIVRFDGIEAIMPVSRDQGWIEFSPDQAMHIVTRVRNGALQMRAVRYDHDYDSEHV